ncbi:hypothetical protein DSUL_30089 [Desulfovibrionales bacterium]
MYIFNTECIPNTLPVYFTAFLVKNDIKD